MQHSYLIKTVLSSQSEPTSFLEICQSVCSVLERMASIDSVFTEFDVPSAGSSYKVPSGSTSQEINVIAERMANDLIENAREDIAREENEPNPTINFKRSIGLSRSLHFTKVKKNKLDVSFSLGGNYSGIFNIEYFAVNKEKYHSLKWYETIQKCVIDHFNPTYSALIFADMLFSAERKEMKLPHALGWMTYIKDDSGIVVPDTMQDVVVEQYAEGKFVLISRDEGYSESLSLADKRVKVLAGMKQLRVEDKSNG